MRTSRAGAAANTLIIFISSMPKLYAETRAFFISGKSVSKTTSTNIRSLLRITFQSTGAGIAPKFRIVPAYK